MTNTKILNTSSCMIQNFSVVTFMQPAYFNFERSYHDEARGMYCFIHDKQKLGTLTDKQQRNANDIMKYFIPHGYSVENLNGINYVPYFEMEDTEGFNPAKEVNIGLYDLDNDKILTKKMRWNKEHSYNAGTEQFPDEAWEGRKGLYTECEAIGKTLPIKSSGFTLTSDMLDFEKVEYDSESIFIPFTNNVFTDTSFQLIIDFFQQETCDLYSDEYWEDGLISGDYSFVIWKNDDNSLTYKIQFMADNDFGSGCCDVYKTIQLSDKEIQILQPIMDKAFGEKKVVA